MAEAIVLHEDYYVYILFREDGVTPFYVGMGRNGRWLEHEIRAKHGRSRKDNIIWDMKQRGISVPKKKFAEGLSKARAIDLEIDLIASIGRRPHGPLANLTDGGEGLLNLCPEAAQRRLESLRATVKTPEHRAKLSAAWKPKTPEQEAYRLRMLREKGHSPEAHAKQAAALRGRPKTAEHVAKVSAALKGRSQPPRPPEVRAAISASMKGRKKSPEHVAAAAKALTGRKVSDESRQRMREARLRYLEKQKQGLSENADVSSEHTGMHD